MRLKQSDRIRVSDNFYLDEFIHPDIYKKHGARSIWFLDPRLIPATQIARDIFGASFTINTWATGGSRINSGVRLPNSRIGAKWSQHKAGRAIDPKIKGITNYDDARKIVRENWEVLHDAGWTTIELGTNGWLHIDMRNTGKSTLFEVPFY